ncbi:39S ribosomal protein L21, mitochondrial [Neodiprion lecontei]|uniref:Large ribosomal subunit protein bL21m n=1 Tax=Neodiprion lecontei TaxID=441921 RepID=A0A6J0B565_NEOLC|nr:39S ribosomal protein L21, mitochondrial [Neodiprion lecontei]
MAAFVGFSRVLAGVANNCMKRIGPRLLNNVSSPGFRLWQTPAAGLRSQALYDPKRAVPSHQEEVKDTTEEDEKITHDVIEKVNSIISTASAGRLFAIVHICGKQFKVTDNDVIIIQGRWPPNIGDKLTLEKVLLVGSSDFTLIGRPLLNRECVSVDATVIEKSLSHTKTHFKKKRRKQFMRINFVRTEHTMLRINSINIKGKLNERKEFEGLDRIF